MRGNPDNVAGGIDERQLELILQDLDGLTTLPGVAGRLLHATRDLDADRRSEDAEALAQVIDIVRWDPALAAKVLAEAATLGPPTLSVGRAVRMIGLPAVRSIALTTRTFDPSAVQSGLDMPGFWRHCIAAAMLTEALAKRLHLPIEPGEAALCGLLHDLGKAVLAQVFPKSYARALEMLAAENTPLAACERAVLGVDHALAGRRLAIAWRLGETLANVLWLHHQAVEALPGALGDRKLILAVKLADALARREGLGPTADPCPPEEPEQIARHLGLSAADLRQIVEAVAAPLERQCNQLQLDSPDALASYQQAVGQAVGELGRLNQQLRRRGALLAAQAQAFGRLRELAASLRPEATVGETLLEIAKAFSAARGHGPTPRRPAVAYSLDEEGDILALCWSGAGEGSRRILPRSESAAPPTAAEPADAAMARLLEDPADLAEWIDLAEYTHHPLLCGGRWVGGVLTAGPASPAGEGDEEVCASLAAAMALALALVQGRTAAVRLGERLASASQALAETQEALTEARTISAIGEMASGAAHELNNPLAIVSGRAQLMRNRAATDEERKIWDLIAEQAHRISDIVTELMEFASPPRPKLQAADAREILAAAAKDFSSAEHPKSASARVDIETGEGLPPVLCDAGQIGLALVELLANAAMAARENSRIVLAAEAGPAGDTVVFRVADSGAGMGPATLANAFMPFFSAQQAGRRRGMGLPRAKRHVENNGGRIWIRSKLGEGTTVFVELPSAAGGEGDNK